MSAEQQKSPTTRDQAEQPKLFAQSQFHGMVKGEGVPLSEIDESNVYRWNNFIGYGKSFRGRPGTRRYSKAVIPNEGTFTAALATDLLQINSPSSGHNLLDGDKVRLNTTGTLPSPLSPLTTYYAIYVGDVLLRLATTYANAIAGTWIDITTLGAGTHTIRYAANIGAAIDHKKEKKLVKLYGRRVYVAERPMESWQEVINLESVTPSGIGRMIENDGNVTLAAGPIFRVVLDDDFYYMYRLNTTIPNVIITDVPEVVGTNEYGHRYYYSGCRLTGNGNRNRTSKDTVLVHETGTAKNANQEQQFGEVFFTTPIGINLETNHILQWLTLPITDQSISHYPLYRTKNIGKNTGGETNNDAYYVWAEDVPVCKSMSITVIGNVATIVGGQNEWVRGDVGCTLRTDEAGTRSGVIELYIDPTNVQLAVGATLGAAENVAIGEGRIITAAQTGYLITRTDEDLFLKTDEGRTFYWGDGSTSVLKRYVDSDNFEAAVDATHASMAATIQRDSGTYAFRRKWNDTVRDDAVAFGEIGLHERMISQEQLYIPLYNYEPIPQADIVVSDEGFSVFALRDDVNYWYSNIGAKEYSEGQFRTEQQYGKINQPIKEIKIMPSMATIICATSVHNLSLNVPINNVGNAAVGEFVQKLIDSYEVDGDIGATHWPTIRKVNASLFIALTSEPAIRLFDGQSWSKENLAIEPNGDPAVMRDLNRMDAYYNLIAWYSYLGGFKIRASRWEPV